MTSKTIKLKAFIESHDPVHNIQIVGDTVQFDLELVRIEGGRVIDSEFEHHIVRTFSQARFSLGY